jgi:hypothetical protein
VARGESMTEFVQQHDAEQDGNENPRTNGFGASSLTESAALSGG